MGRVANAHTDHITRWVIPTATKLFIEAAAKGVNVQPLKKVVHIEMGQSPKSESYNTLGDGIPYIGGPADLGLKFPKTRRWTNAPTKLCQSGDLIICVRATIGEPRWADNVYCLGRGVAGLRPTDKNLDSKFLFRVVQANEQALREKGTGTTFKTISKKHIAAIPIPMVPLEIQKSIGNFLEWLEKNKDEEQIDFAEAPALPDSLSEQHRIVARVEALAAKVEAARTLREEAGAGVEALLDSTYHAIFDSSKLKPFLVRLGEADLVLNLENRDPSKDDRRDTFAYINISTVTGGKPILLNNAPLLPTKESPSRARRVIHKDDVIFSTVRPYLRTVAKIGQKLDNEICSTGYAVFSCGRTIDPDFLLHQFYSPFFIDQCMERVTGGHYPAINLTNLQKTFIAIPPLSKQRRIVAHLDALQAKLNAVQEHQAATQARLDALLPAILDRAFRGEL